MEANQQPMVFSEARQDWPKRAERIVYPENPRYRRIRFVSRLMDQSITLPTGYRIGLDPLLGLVPGIGDALGSTISCYLVYEAARLGLPKRALAQMLVNITLEALAGSFPVIGDIFDVFWKANVRNFRLVDRYYHPAMPERPAGRIAGWFVMLALVLVAGILGCVYLIIQFFKSLLAII